MVTADTASDLLPNLLCLEPFTASNMNDLLALTLLNFLLKSLSVCFTVHFLFLFFLDYHILARHCELFFLRNDFQLLLVLFTFAVIISELVLKWNTPLSLFAVVRLLSPRFKLV